MNTKDYFLELIIHFFEQVQKIQDPVIKRKEFEEKILKNQTKLYTAGHFTRKEFVNECQIAIEYLRNYVRNGINSEKHKDTTGKNLFSILEPSLKITKITNLNAPYNTLLINIPTYQGNTSRIKLSLNDVNFIESMFDDITFGNHQQPNVNITQKKDIKRHNEIFTDNSFFLFQYILENFIRKDKGRYEDLSFFYWKMRNDGYIHQKPFVFKDWFTLNFNNEKIFTKVKTLDQVKTAQRERNYSISKELFKQELKKSTISDF